MSRRELYPFLDTPALVVDMDKLEANLHQMARTCQQAGVKLRPHVKTHKSPYLANLQLECGASGITVAKLGEAEAMANHGIRDILIAYPLSGWHKLARLRALMERADVSICLDSIEVARGISEVARDVGRRVPVLVEINTGLDRVGVLPGDEARRLASQVAGLPGLELSGIMSFEGQALFVDRSPAGIEKSAVAFGERMVEEANQLRAHGLNVREISVGSTLSANHIVHVEGITELRAGTYVFNDLNQIAFGVGTVETCSLSVLVSVASIPANDRAVIDAGSKTFSSATLEHLGMCGFGHIKGHHDLQFARMSEEHGVIHSDGHTNGLKVGDRLEIVPNSASQAVNLADTLYAVRHGTFEREIPVGARGKSQ